MKDPDGKFRNRAWLFGPDGLIGYQDKQIMTRFEREQWNIDAGIEGLKAFATPIGRLGILICYDNEFPMLGRRLAELGVELVLAPSCTDTLAGAYRVRIGAQARALENQYAVLSAPTAGRPHGLPPSMRIAAAPPFTCRPTTACPHPVSSRKAKAMR